MSKELDLTKMRSEPCCLSEESMPSGETIHLSWDKPYDLPDEGTATVRFKVRRRSQDVANKRYEVTVELLKMSDIKGKTKSVMKPRGSETEMALDKLREEAMEEYED